MLKVFLVILPLLTLTQLSLGQKDVEGGKDPALFSRMPGFIINQHEENEFAAFEFTIKNQAKFTVEGQKIMVAYAWPSTGKKPSSLQVINNYENAMKRIGGKTLYKTNDFLTLSLIKDGKEIWAQIDSEVDAGWGGYILTIVQKEKMEQQVTADAKAMFDDILAKGHVALYGILFDTGKAEIKPKSLPVIAEIAKLLKERPGLKIHIVGHTDNVGNADSNLKLSAARAQAVRKILLETHKIQPARLNVFGAGPYCPVATNANEAGRAQNRRVELVSQ